MSLLTIVQRFCKRTNLDVPSTVLGTTDPQIKQIGALLEEEGNNLAGRGDWQELTNEALLTTGLHGTTTITIVNGLIDSTANFTESSVPIGTSVINNDTGATSTVTSVNNTQYLSLASNIFTGVGESYSLAVESQGNINDIASNGFNYIKNGTIWDRDLRLPVYVIDGTDWQQVKAIAVTGPRYQARIRGNLLISNPVPAVNHTWAFEYISKNWITDSAGTNPDNYFNSDDDEVILPNELVLLGLRWRWLKEKGLEYAEQFATYEGEVKDALSRNNMRRPLSMSQTAYTPHPKVFIPDGDWNI